MRCSALAKTAAMLGALTFFAGCGKPAARVRPPRAQPAEASLSPEAQFAAGRAKLFAGDYAAGAEILRSLDESGKAPPASRDWVALYAGMAELLANRESEARAIFARLAERLTSGPEGGQWGVFFSDLAKRLSGSRPVPTDIVSRYDRQSSEAIALFLYALKNEQLGAFDDALTFYRQFTTASASGPEPWPGFNNQLRQFRQTALDLLEYEDLVDTATRARNAPDAETDARVARAVQAAKAMRQKIRRETKLLASLDERLGDKVQMSAAEDEADAEVFPAAREKWAACIAQFDFAGAKQAIFEPKLKAAKTKQEQEMLGARADNLERFKFYLILELGSKGSDHPLTLKNGTTVAGFTSMDDTKINVRAGGEVKATPWSEIAPESLFALAKSLINPNEAADAAAFRKWHLGNLAVLIGKMDEARALLAEAAQENPAYADEMPLILGSAAK